MRASLISANASSSLTAGSTPNHGIGAQPTEGFAAALASATPLPVPAARSKSADVSDTNARAKLSTGEKKQPVEDQTLALSAPVSQVAVLTIPVQAPVVIEPAPVAKEAEASPETAGVGSAHTEQAPLPSMPASYNAAGFGRPTAGHPATGSAANPVSVAEQQFASARGAMSSSNRADAEAAASEPGSASAPQATAPVSTRSSVPQSAAISQVSSATSLPSSPPVSSWSTNATSNVTSSPPAAQASAPSMLASQPDASAGAPALPTPASRATNETNVPALSGTLTAQMQAGSNLPTATSASTTASVIHLPSTQVAGLHATIASPPVAANQPIHAMPAVSSPQTVAELAAPTAPQAVPTPAILPTMPALPPAQAATAASGAAADTASAITQATPDAQSITPDPAVAQVLAAQSLPTAMADFAIQGASQFVTPPAGALRAEGISRPGKSTAAPSTSPAMGRDTRTSATRPTGADGQTGDGHTPAAASSSAQGNSNSAASVAPSPAVVAHSSTSAVPVPPAPQDVAQGAAAEKLSPGSKDGQGADVPPSTPGADAAAALADAHSSTSINTARVLQSMQGSEMRVGMHSAEFGSVSINTTMNHQTLAAEISFEHADLGRAISAHLPAIESKLSDYGMQAKVEMREQSTALNSAGSSQSFSSQGGRGGNGTGQGHNRGTGAANVIEGIAAAAATAVSSDGMTSSRLSIRI